MADVYSAMLRLVAAPPPGVAKGFGDESDAAQLSARVYRTSGVRLRSKRLTPVEEQLINNRQDFLVRESQLRQELIDDWHQSSPDRWRGMPAEVRKRIDGHVADTIRHQWLMHKKRVRIRFGESPTDE